MKYLRLKKQADFQKLFQSGRRVFSQSLTMIIKPSKDLKMGISIGKKHGKAVKRNRIKRLLREAFSQVVGDFQGKYYVVLIPKVAEEYTLKTFRANLQWMIKKNGRRVINNQLELHAYQQLYFTTFDYGKLRPLFNGGREYPIKSIHPSVHILLIAGIASPEPLMEELAQTKNAIHSLFFSDHHDFSMRDMETIEQKFQQLPEGKRMIITTEKDAVRMMAHPHLPDSVKPYIYVLPIEVTFLQGQQHMFNQNILDYVRKNSRNSRFSEE